MNKRRVSLAASIALLAVWAQSGSAASFGAGNLVIYRVGTGTSALNNAATAVFLDEYNVSGTLLQSLALPTADNGAQQTLTASGTATSEGLLTRSANGHYLALTGYDATPGTAGVAGTSAATVGRTVAVVGADGAVDTTTRLTDAPSGNNIRSAYTTDGDSLWVTGAAGGVRATTRGASSGQQLSTTVTNLRQVNEFGGQLYVSTGSGSAVRVGTVGSGLPTTSGQSIVNLPGFSTSGSPYGFFFADLSAGVAGLDTLYVADDAAGLSKYSFNGTSWSSKGTVGAAADALRGLTASVVGNSVQLFAIANGGSSAAGGGRLVALSDTSGYDGSLTGTLTTLATAANNTAFRGVAFAPTPVPLPMPVALLGVAVAGLGALRRRRDA